MAKSILCRQKKGPLLKPYPWANPSPPNPDITEPAFISYCIISKINPNEAPIP